MDNDPDKAQIDSLNEELEAGTPAGPEIRKRKVLEALGCLLYVIAFLIMGSVLIVKFGKL